MTTLQSEVFEAFRSIDVPEDKAIKAATALSRRDDEVSSLQADMLVLKWMLGFCPRLSTRHLRQTVPKMNNQPIAL